MRLNRILLVLVLFIFIPGFSDQKEISNNKNESKTISTDDKIVIRKNITFAAEYREHPDILRDIMIANELRKEGKNDESEYLLNSLLKKCSEIKFTHGLSDVELILGEIHYNWGNYDKALKHFLRSRSIASSLDYETTEAAAFNFIGKYYHTIGNFRRSMNFLRKGIEIARNTSDSAITSELYRNIGNYYNTTGNHAKALEVLYKSLEYLDEKQDPLNYASTCNHIGNVYQDRGNLRKALQYHRNALELRKSINNQDDIGKSLKNLGEVYEDLGDQDSAIHLYKEAEAIFHKTGYKKGSIKIANNMGRIYACQNRIEEGINLLKKALMLSSESGYSKGIMNAHYELGNCYLQTFDRTAAFRHFTIALKESKNHGVKELEREIYKRLYEFYRIEKNYEKALEYQLKYASINDSIKNLQYIANIDELAVKYETRVKEQENSFLKKQNDLQQTAIKRKNIILWISAVSIFSLLIAIYSIFQNLRNKKKDNKKLIELNERLKSLNHKLNESNAEKDKLYSVFVHELRNPLLWFRNITRMLSRNYKSMDEKNVKKALESLDESATHSYHLMDNLLQWTRSQLGKIEIKPEVFDLELIIHENIQFANTAVKFRNIKIDYSGKSCKVEADKMMINTIIRNLISNAIKFTRENGRIFIQTEIKNETVQVSVRDTGVGINQKDQVKIFDPVNKFSRTGIMKEKGSGIGLLLCKEFVEKNKGKLSFSSKKNKGSVFIFELPVLKLKSIKRKKIESKQLEN